MADDRRHGDLEVRGTRFWRDGAPFPFTGISFFNAVYNPAFNANSQARREWLRVFARHGINVLRVWGQWNCTRGWVDAGPGQSLYEADGALRARHMETLKALLTDADAEGMVVELALFARETWNDGNQLSDEAMDRGAAAVARELLGWRNLTLQIWNEHDYRVNEAVKLIREVDAKRLVTNSPGYPGILGVQGQNSVLDYLTPHTSRQGNQYHWEVAAGEVRYLLQKYGKPVVDDEPARNGTPKFGGPPGPTDPYDHILQIAAVWAVGGYVNYHHNMFQTGAGSSAVPPSGIPEPGFSDYHRQVLEFMAKRERYMH